MPYTKADTLPVPFSGLRVRRGWTNNKNHCMCTHSHYLRSLWDVSGRLQSLQSCRSGRKFLSFSSQTIFSDIDLSKYLGSYQSENERPYSVYTPFCELCAAGVVHFKLIFGLYTTALCTQSVAIRYCLFDCQAFALSARFSDIGTTSWTCLECSRVHALASFMTAFLGCHN